MNKLVIDDVLGHVRGATFLGLVLDLCVFLLASDGSRGDFMRFASIALLNATAHAIVRCLWSGNTTNTWRYATNMWVDNTNNLQDLLQIREGRNG